MSDAKHSLHVRLAAPRGFCAGVERAIQIVEQALEKWGAPVYVRHEIVHNAHVVERLEAAGAVFVEELAACPDDRPVIFSAHGVPKSVPDEARRRNMVYVDATCPLVSKVHIEAAKHYDAGRDIVLIGHDGHPEVEGTLGQLPPGAITLVETIEDADAFAPEDPNRLAYVTQTTLSVDDAADIIAVLKRRFPNIEAPFKDDICYATTNRQDAVKQIAQDTDLVIVVGARNSSNSCRLVDAALAAGARQAELVGDASDIDWTWFDTARRVGLTAGASAPEDLVEGVMDAFSERFDLQVEEVTATRENVVFKLPRELTV